jgi:drug/metabolite transporter (DMT)-like permease
LWSKLFFGEPFNRNKIVGLALVLIGVFFIGLGNQ